MDLTPNATRSAIVFDVTKEMLGEFLLRSEDDPLHTVGLDELESMFDRCKDMTSPSIENHVTMFKYLRRFGVMDNITKLRGLSTWAYVQKNMFLGLGEDEKKVTVFKMYEVGPGSGVDLVKRMQPGGDHEGTTRGPRGDLENAWVMFDHYKRVKDRTTMGCHVYDSTYCCVMTIACCDMQFEDAIAQQVF